MNVEYYYVDTCVPIYKLFLTNTMGNAMNPSVGKLLTIV